MSVTADASGGFQQRLGLFDGAMLVAGSMIGSGIFLVSAEIARDVGSSGWLLAVVAGVAQLYSGVYLGWFLILVYTCGWVYEGSSVSL